MTGQRKERTLRPPGIGRPEIRAGILGLFVLALLPSATRGETPQAAVDREYQVKVAFVYNFIKFVSGARFGPAEGPVGASVDPNGAIVVGVVGKPPSKESFAGLRGRLVTDKRLEVRFFESLAVLKDAEGKTPDLHPQMKELRQCHVLFVCPSERPFLARLLPPLQKDGLLLVGDTPGFLEAGGIINLVIEDKKVRFEVNLAAAARGKLQIRSSLLRLAIRTMEHDPLERQGNEDQ
jgi:hypothetical protein